MTTGTQGIVLNSLSELVQVRDRFPACDPVSESLALVPVADRSDPEAIATLTSPRVPRSTSSRRSSTGTAAVATRRPVDSSGGARW